MSFQFKFLALLSVALLALAGSLRAQASCNCGAYWRVTHRPTDAKPVNDRLPQTVWERSGHRRQTVEYARPYLNASIRDAHFGAAVLPGIDSKGDYIIKVELIGGCADAHANAHVNGHSNPIAYFTGRTEGDASYEVSSSMQAIFTKCTAANNSLRFTEKGSSSGYQLSVSFSPTTTGPSSNPIPGVSGSIRLRLPTSFSGPHNFPHLTPFKQDMKPSDFERLKLKGRVYSKLRADGYILMDPASAHAELNRADHRAGIGFGTHCSCDPTGPNPDPSSGNPGGTTGGSGGGGGTTGPAGGGTPGGTFGLPGTGGYVDLHEINGWVRGHTRETQNH